MKEFGMILGLFFYFVNGPSFAIGVTDLTPTKNSSSVSINVHANLGTTDTVSSPFLNLKQWTLTASLLQTTKRLSETKTIIASNNKAKERSSALISGPILPVLSTPFIAQTRTNEIVNRALSTNVPQEKLAMKHSSLNIQNYFFSAKEHSSAISSMASVITPETAPTTSKFNGINLPLSSIDKKYVPTSRAGDNSNGYSSQGAFAKSALLDVQRKGLNSHTGQFSSSNSILGQISDYGANDGSRLFTKGSMSRSMLPRTFLLSSQTIWKSTELNPQTDATTLLFSDKADTSRLHATQTLDTKVSTSAMTRKFSSISGMPQFTFAAKMSQEDDLISMTFPPSRPNQMVASSVVHSTIEKISLVSSVVMTSPSVSSKTRKISSLSSSATTTISATPMIQQPLTSRMNSRLSSKPQNEFRTLSNSGKEGISSRMSFSIEAINSSKDRTTDFAANGSASIPVETTASVAQGVTSSPDVSTLAPSLAVEELQTQSPHFRPKNASLEMSFTHSSSHISSRFIPQKKSSAVSEEQNFSPSLSSIVTTHFDKTKLKNSSVSPTSRKSEITSEVIVSLPDESVAYKAASTQSGTTVHPTQTRSSSAGTPVTAVTDSVHIELFTVASSVVHSTVRGDISLFSSVVMASPSESSKTRKISSLSSRATIMTISTTPMIQQPFTSRMNNRLSSKPENKFRPLTSSHNEQSSRRMSSKVVNISRDSTSDYATRESISISLDKTTISVPQGMTSSSFVYIPSSSESTLQAQFLTSRTREINSEMSFADSTKNVRARTSAIVKPPLQATESPSPLPLSSTKAESVTELLTQAMVQLTSWVPFSASDQTLISKGSSRSSKHEVRFYSSENSTMTRKSAAPSASYSESPSQITHKKSSAGTVNLLLTSSTEDQNFSPSLSSTVTTVLDKSKLQTFSSTVSSTPAKSEITSEIIFPVPGESVTSYIVESIQLGATVHPTQTRSSSATVIGNISTESPTTAATDSGHIKLLIIIAIIPSIILCAFFAAVLLFRRSRKRRNKAVYSIKLEYADENSGFRKRCVNSRLDLSLKGIHIDLEFPNAPSDRERRGSYGRDSPRYSRGSNLSETQMRELQILSQECRENMEWISEVIAREMEASICGRIQPVNRESVYSVKEKENYEPSEKGIIRRESSKRGRESVKWRVPVVQRRDSEDFDQRDSMCTDDTMLFPEDWKDGLQNSERSMPRNGTETQTKINQISNLPGKENGDEANLDKELRVQLSNRILDQLHIQDKDKKEKELAENIPLTVNLNSKKEDASQVTQGKRSSARPRRFETL